MNFKTKIPEYIRLFVPSAMGAVFYTFVTGIVMFLNQFSVLQSYLQIPKDADFFHIILGGVNNFLLSAIGQGRTETLVVGAFWAFVGLGVYIFLKGIAHFMLELGSGWEARNFVWPKGVNPNQSLIEAIEKTLFRICAFVGFLILLFWPLAHLVAGPVLADFIGSTEPVRYVFWFGFLWLTLHALIVMVRLMVLKPRIFN